MTSLAHGIQPHGRASRTMGPGTVPYAASTRRKPFHSAVATPDNRTLR